MDLSISSAVLFLLLRFLTNNASEGAVTSQGESISPKWSADLRSAIGSGPIGVVTGGKGHEYEYKPKTSLWFTDNNTIVVTFVTRDSRDNPKLSHRDGPGESLPLRLRTVFVDAVSGLVKASPDWPAKSRLASIVAAHDGKFVAQTANELTLYSSDSAGLKELKKLQLPERQEIEWGAHPSPTGRNILFVASNLTTHSAVHWIWVETDSLQVVRSWEETQSGWVGISDNKIAMTKCVWFYNCEPNVEVKGLNTEWKMIASANRKNKPHPQFVNDDLIFLLGNPTRLIQTDGKLVFSESVSSEGCWWGGIYPSAGGQRFVIPSCKLKGHVEFLDLGGYDELKRIIVYDAPFQGRSHALDVKGPKIKELTLLAVSPDGTKLAILNGESLYAFDLPPLA